MHDKFELHKKYKKLSRLESAIFSGLVVEVAAFKTKGNKVSDLVPVTPEDILESLLLAGPSKSIKYHLRKILYKGFYTLRNETLNRRIFLLTLSN